MLLHAQQFADAGIPFIFDPGQGILLFNGEEFRAFIDKASYVVVNDYEAEVLTKRTGWTLEQIAAKVEALIVTRGEIGRSHDCTPVHNARPVCRLHLDKTNITTKAT